MANVPSLLLLLFVVIIGVELSNCRTLWVEQDMHSRYVPHLIIFNLEFIFHPLPSPPPNTHLLANAFWVRSPVRFRLDFVFSWLLKIELGLCNKIFADGSLKLFRFLAGHPFVLGETACFVGFNEISRLSIEVSQSRQFLADVRVKWLSGNANYWCKFPNEHITPSCYFWGNGVIGAIPSHLGIWFENANLRYCKIVGLNRMLLKEIYSKLKVQKTERFNYLQIKHWITLFIGT